MIASVESRHLLSIYPSVLHVNNIIFSQEIINRCWIESKTFILVSVVRPASQKYAWPLGVA